MTKFNAAKLTMARMMDQAAERYPEREAIVFKGRRLTWSALRAQSMRLAKALLNAGVKKGDKVGVMITNIPEWVIARVAIMRVGAWLIRRNTHFTLHGFSPGNRFRGSGQCRLPGPDRPPGRMRTGPDQGAAAPENPGLPGRPRLSGYGQLRKLHGIRRQCTR
ncbi:MAG: AMP-binding protein [Desulfobacterales bacterium]|nr:AMP-binding protein [Desulfobacterales bacterium]